MKSTLAIGALLLASGCAMHSAQRGEELMDSVMTYHDGLRWERLAAAASRIPPAERDDFVDERDELAKNLKITDWDVVKVSRVSDARARIQVKYTWYLDDEGTVHETQAVERWERRAKAWLLVDERFARGDDMPGLAEPDPDPAPAADGGAAAPGDGVAAADPAPEAM